MKISQQNVSSLCVDYNLLLITAPISWETNKERHHCLLKSALDRGGESSALGSCEDIIAPIMLQSHFQHLSHSHRSLEFYSALFEERYKKVPS